jgi:hypothetical protein
MALTFLMSIHQVDQELEKEDLQDLVVIREILGL